MADCVKIYDEYKKLGYITRNIETVLKNHHKVKARAIKRGLCEELLRDGDILFIEPIVKAFEKKSKFKVPGYLLPMLKVSPNQAILIQQADFYTGRGFDVCWCFIKRLFPESFYEEETLSQEHLSYKILKVVTALIKQDVGL